MGKPPTVNYLTPPGPGHSTDSEWKISKLGIMVDCGGKFHEEGRNLPETVQVKEIRIIVKNLTTYRTKFRRTKVPKI